MIKALYVLSIVVLTGSSAFAADATLATTAMKAPAVVTAPVVPNLEVTFKGTVKSVSLADAVKGTKSEVIVVSQSGQETALLVKSTSTLYDGSAKAITLDKIIAGDTVSGAYTVTPEGVKEAKTIKIAK